MEKTLNDLRDKIKEYVETIDIKPYSSNLITLTLRQIDKNFGVEKASETIDIFDLETLGYRKKNNEH
tara:strand:- start:294 stop:494 length:201 start_codon:yes stop_codon:yes gene_type:complete